MFIDRIRYNIYILFCTKFLVYFVVQKWRYLIVPSVAGANCVELSCVRNLTVQRLRRLFPARKWRGLVHTLSRHQSSRANVFLRGRGSPYLSPRVPIHRAARGTALNNTLTTFGDELRKYIATTEYFICVSLCKLSNQLKGTSKSSCDWRHNFRSQRFPRTIKLG